MTANQPKLNLDRISSLCKSDEMRLVVPHLKRRVTTIRKGFSLIELLCVMAIMSVVMVLVVPVTGALKGAGDVNAAALNVSLVLEQARGYAMAHNTYVWVGFNAGGSGGAERVRVSAVAGSTGAPDDLATAATYRPLLKGKTFENLRMGEVTTSLVGREVADNISSSQMGSFTQQQGGESVTYSQLVRFAPSGVAQIKADGNSRWIEMGLLASNSQANVAVFQIAGLTGQVNVLRP